MKEEILKLRESGKSYNQIKNIVKCSKGTISYYCGNNQKEKTLARTKRQRKTLLGILKRKKDNFSVLYRKPEDYKLHRREKSKFTAREFEKRLVGNPICYLTGRKIDLLSPKTYQCDHMIPVSKGGQNTLTNLGLTCKEANIAKADMTPSEFFELCKEVLEHNGYKVEKICS